MSYEHNYTNWYNKDDKKKTVAFTTEASKIGEEIDENQDEIMALINRGVRQMLWQRRQRPQQDFKNNDIKMNENCCYYYEKPGYIKLKCPEQKRGNNHINKYSKSFGVWD